DFGPFLGQSAILERIGELGRLPDAHQKLRLSQQPMNIHAVLLRGRRERGEIYVRRDVLFPGRFVRVRTGGMLPVGHDGAAMPPRENFVTRVTIINDDKESSPD